MRIKTGSSTDEGRAWSLNASVGADVLILLRDLFLCSLGNEAPLLLRVDEVVVIRELRVAVAEMLQGHAFPGALLLAEGDVLDAKLIALVVVRQIAPQAAHVLVSPASGGLHVDNLIAQVEILLALGGQLLAVVLVPSEGILLVLLLELVHFLEDVAEDVAAMHDQLPVLEAIILRLIELLTQFRDLFFQILGVI